MDEKMNLLLVGLIFLILTLSVNAVSTCSKLGDVDGDGHITSTDADIAFQIAIGNGDYTSCADIDGSGVVTAGDAQAIYGMIEDYCGDGSCNNGETCSTCSTDCGACSSGNGGGLGPYCGDGVCNGVETNNPNDYHYCAKDCPAPEPEPEENLCVPNVEYSDWSDCVDGSQTRTYTVTNDCDNEPKDLILEQACEEVVELEESPVCNDNNPCTKGRWYQRSEDVNGSCVFDAVNGINCYKDGVIGVCQNKECVVPEPKQTETKKEIVKKTNTTTGFFGLSNLTSLGLGFLFLIALILGYVGLTQLNSSSKKK